MVDLLPFRPVLRHCNTLVPVTTAIIPHLQWWAQWQNLPQGVRFPSSPPEVTLTTDASLPGWGAYIGEASASGQWLPPWDAFHMNRLELEAVARALVQFVHLVKGRKVLARSDSTTVVAYINRQGGTHSFNLWIQSWNLFLWTSQQAITLEAIHLPGIHNTRADALSRQWQQSFEWMLNPTIFSQVVDRCRIYPEVDLFASPANNQTPMFCSQYPHQRVWRVNALSFPWRGRVFYAFPPPALVTRVLLKIDSEGTLSILLIAPFWPARAWFPKLVRLLAGQPFRLPPLPDLLSLPDQDLLYPDPAALAGLGCLAPIRESFIKEVFSEEAALMAAQGRRPSTLNLYNRRLRLFGEWCSGRSIGPSEASVGQIADFLLYLFKTR